MENDDSDADNNTRITQLHKRDYPLYLSLTRFVDGKSAKKFKLTDAMLYCLEREATEKVKSIDEKSGKDILILYYKEGEYPPIKITIRTKCNYLAETEKNYLYEVMKNKEKIYHNSLSFLNDVEQIDTYSLVDHAILKQMVNRLKSQQLEQNQITEENISNQSIDRAKNDKLNKFSIKEKICSILNLQI